MLSSTWYLCSTEADADAIEEVSAAQAVRREMLKQCFEQDCIFCPVARAAAANHWTLLVVVKSKGVVQYFDSLAVCSPGNMQLAKALMSEFLPDVKFPEHRANAALQPAGSSVCGCFVLHWLEQACRTHLLNESPCSIGWPMQKVWATRLCKLAVALAAEKQHLEDDNQKATMKELKQLEQKIKKDACMKKSKVAEATAAGLAEHAAAAFSKVPPTKPCRENLSPEAQAAIKLVEDMGMGVCSKCKFLSGCLNCHAEKALQYWLQKEFGHLM